jgi:molybdopterin converting factor small subunit
MVTVQVRLYATLRRYRPELGHGEALRVEMPDGSRVANLLEKLGIPRDETKQVFVDGLHKPMDFVLRDGQQVGVFPPIAGG